jgi:hypothetical protein
MPRRAAELARCLDCRSTNTGFDRHFDGFDIGQESVHHSFNLVDERRRRRTYSPFAACQEHQISLHPSSMNFFMSDSGLTGPIAFIAAWCFLMRSINGTLLLRRSRRETSYLRRQNIRCTIFRYSFRNIRAHAKSASCGRSHSRVPHSHGTICALAIKKWLPGAGNASTGRATKARPIAPRHQPSEAMISR